MAKDIPALSPLPGLNSRSNLVADAIRDAILRGDFPPGSELVERNLAGHGQVVVSGEADSRVLTGQLHAGVRLCAIADEIAEAPDLRGRAVRDRLEGRLERVPVAVDVRDHRDLHLVRVGTPLGGGRSTGPPLAGGHSSMPRRCCAAREAGPRSPRAGSPTRRTRAGS